MKLLDVDEITSLNVILASGVKGVSWCNHGRVDVYSCKRVTQDKRIAKKMKERGGVRLSPSVVAQEGSMDEDFAPLTPLAVEPPQVTHSTLPSTSQQEDTDDVVDLVSTLNVSFPDHDFSDLPSTLFCRETLDTIRQTVSMSLSAIEEGLRDTGFSDFENAVWKEIDRVVNLSTCSFFSFRPEERDSPVSNAVWERYVFFLNRAPDVNKLVFMHLYGVAEDEPMAEEDLGGGESISYGGCPYSDLHNQDEQDVAMLSGSSPMNDDCFIPTVSLNLSQ